MQKYQAKAIQTKSGRGVTEYFEYYKELFSDKNFRPKPRDYTFINDTTLDNAIKEAVDDLGVGKSLSTDLIPDTCFNKEELKRMAINDKRILFNGRRPDVTLRAKAILLSKTGSRIAEPD